MTTATANARTKSTRHGNTLGESRIPRALLEADVATLRLALEQKQKEEIQEVLEQIREIDARRTELNAKLIGLGYRNGSPSRSPVTVLSRRSKRSELADGMAETIITETLQQSPGERPGFYYEKVISAGGNMGQARRILAALVAGGKVKAEGNRPHTRYALA